MNRDITILNELRELNSPLAGLTNENLYQVPEGYFEKLSVQVLNRVHAIEAENPKDELRYLSSFLSGMPKNIPFIVPAGYFESIEQRLLEIMNPEKELSVSEELNEIAPILGSMDRKLPFSVPEGYFDDLSSSVKTGIRKEPAKVVSIKTIRWFRYAAAAVAVILISTIGFVIIRDKKENGEKAMVKFEKDVKKLDIKETENLIQYLDAGMSGNEVAENNGQKKTDEVEELLKGIPESELEEFLQQTEDTEDVLLVN